MLRNRCKEDDDGNWTTDAAGDLGRRGTGNPGAVGTSLTEQQLRRGVHQSSGELEAAIHRYLDITNQDPKPFVWTKTADQILANVARFYSQ